MAGRGSRNLLPAPGPQQVPRRSGPRERRAERPMRPIFPPCGCLNDGSPYPPSRIGSGPCSYRQRRRRTRTPQGRGKISFQPTVGSLVSTVTPSAPVTISSDSNLASVVTACQSCIFHRLLQKRARTVRPAVRGRWRMVRSGVSANTFGAKDAALFARLSMNAMNS